MTDAHWLFSYGSNSPSRLAGRLQRAHLDMVAAWAPGWQRAFRGESFVWGGGVATIERVRGATTYGYCARVTDDDLRLLDRYEGVPSGVYRRERVLVETNDGPLTAVAYVHTSSTFNPPSDDYLEAVAATVGAFWAGPEGRPVRPKDFPLR